MADEPGGTGLLRTTLAIKYYLPHPVSVFFCKIQKLIY